MVAVLAEATRNNAFDARATNAALTTWGNWYIHKTGHELGWTSHNHLLNYYGLFVNGHKILFDTPSHVRFVDVALGGRFPELLRTALAVEYWWHRELETGRKISAREKAEVLSLDSPSQFREVVRTAKLIAQRTMETLDCRRDSATVR
jgi:hypothetical protein